MRTRTLAILGITAAAVGILATIVGLHPAAPKIVLRGGLAVMFASCPLICATQTRRAADVSLERMSAAHLDGYRMGLAHAALGLLDSPPSGGASAPTPINGNSYARGHLRAIGHTERTADQ